MDLVNYLSLDFGQHSPLDLAACLKESNLLPLWQSWLLSQQEILDLAGSSWVYVYSSEGLGLKNLKRIKERAITIGAKDSKNTLADLMLKLCDGKKDIQLIDATAGLLNDTHSLQRLGYALTSFESNPLLALLIMTNSLLKTSFRHLNSSWEFIPSRFNAEELVKFSNPRFTIIMFDPMFEAKNHKSLPSLEMQILSELEQEYPNQALTSQEFRQWQELASAIVVKRPDKAPYIFEIRPKYSINSKLLRWDIY